MIFPKYNTSGTDGSVSISCFHPSKDLDGVASLVPHMDNFYDNSLQSGLMRELAIDLEILGEHPVLLGNQVSMSRCRDLSDSTLIIYRVLARTKL